MLNTKEYCFKFHSAVKKLREKKRNTSLVSNPQMKFWLNVNINAHLVQRAKPALAQANAFNGSLLPPIMKFASCERSDIGRYVAGRIFDIFIKIYKLHANAIINS